MQPAVLALFCFVAVVQLVACWGLTQHVHVLVHCRARLAALEAENEEMRAELSALDPAFFEELEDLKHDHHMLQQRCAHLEGFLAGMTGDDAPSVAGSALYVNMQVEGRGDGEHAGAPEA